MNRNLTMLALSVLMLIGQWTMTIYYSLDLPGHIQLIPSMIPNQPTFSSSWFLAFPVLPTIALGLVWAIYSKRAHLPFPGAKLLTEFSEDIKLPLADRFYQLLLLTGVFLTMMLGYWQFLIANIAQHKPIVVNPQMIFAAVTIMVVYLGFNFVRLKMKIKDMVSKAD